MIPTVLPLKRCLKRLSTSSLGKPDVEEVDHDEKRGPKGCRESSGGEKILEAIRCAPQGFPGLLGAEEEVPAFLGLPDVEEESHEDKHALQGRRR